MHTILGPGRPSERLWLNYPVLALAFFFEGLSFLQAARQVRRQTTRRGQSLTDFVRDPGDPTLNSVALEDSAALVGIVVAAVGVGLHQLTASRVWDGLASVVIAILLLVIAFVLARGCEVLLVGKQADPLLLRGIEARLEDQAEIEDVVDLLTMMTTPGGSCCAPGGFRRHAHRW